MKSIEKIYKGLEILSRYSDLVSAEHDIIYGGYDTGISEVDRKELESLGWHVDKSHACWAYFV